MASQQFVPPPERVDDLSEWERAVDVPHKLRDLFRYFFIRERDLELKEPINVLLQRFQNGSEIEKQEAQAVLGRLQLVVLNLMLKCSGYQFGTEGHDWIAVPVKQWETAMLVGNPSLPRNFGNLHGISRMPDQQKFDTPVSPSEGWMFRMVDFKDNFIKLVQSLNFYEPDEVDSPDVTYRLGSKERKYAEQCIRRFLGPVSEAAPKE